MLLLCPILGWGQQAPAISPYDSAHYSWRKPVPRNRLRELRPDRPGVTESPFTVDAGHAQIEVDGFRLINSGKNEEARTRDLRVAYSNVKLGLSRYTDIQVEVPLYSVVTERPRSAPEWQERNAGFGDLAIRLKHNWGGNDEKVPVAVATLGYVRLPTGGLGGSGGTEYGLLVPVNVAVGDRWTLEAQAASELKYDRQEGQRFLLFSPSVAVDYKFTKKISLLVEGVSQWDTQQKQWQSAFNLASIFNVTDNFQLDIGTHLALDRLMDREFFVGFTLRR
ncbi:transporter [Hymenobacter sp. B1770]|uniref:transporter n=1 Tax=Hymenobacter sp. B1770 TaxID=1718788 RepID=UPI003CF286EC